MSKEHDGNALPPASPDRGTVQAVTDFAAGLAEHIGKRFKLVGLELRHAGMHIGVLVGLAVLAAFGLLLGYLFLTISLVFFLAAATGWSWALVILLLAAAHVLIAVICGLTLWTRIKRPIFPATMLELQKDSEWLRNTSKNSN